MHPQSALLARQPIFDAKIRVCAYEVLFRAQSADTAVFADHDFATADVGVHALLDLGLERIAGDRAVWINIPRSVLVDHSYEFFPADRVVLELLETVEADEQALAAIARARSMGYQIALDDFVLNDRTRALVPLADFVKFDVLALGVDGLKAAIESVRRPGLRILAEKVETYEAFQNAVEAGCELFQGYFFARPQTMRGRRVPSNRVALLRVVAQLQDRHASLEEIENMIRSDVGLSYRLVRYVNSVSIGMRAKIESLRHAIMILGLERVRVCVWVLLLASNDDKPDELITTSLIRARYCQLLADFRGLDPQKGFLVGLLSSIDAFLDRDMEAIVREMGLNEEVSQALLTREGGLGEVLAAAIACEQADWESLERSTVRVNPLRETYLEALNWSARMQTSLSEG